MSDGQAAALLDADIATRDILTRLHTLEGENSSLKAQLEAHDAAACGQAAVSNAAADGSAAGGESPPLPSAVPAPETALVTATADASAPGPSSPGANQAGLPSSPHPSSDDKLAAATAVSQINSDSLPCPQCDVIQSQLAQLQAELDAFREAGAGLAEERGQTADALRRLESSLEAEYGSRVEAEGQFDALDIEFQKVEAEMHSVREEAEAKLHGIAGERDAFAVEADKLMKAFKEMEVENIELRAVNRAQLQQSGGCSGWGGGGGGGRSPHHAAHGLGSPAEASARIRDLERKLDESRVREEHMASRAREERRTAKADKASWLKEKQELLERVNQDILRLSTSMENAVKQYAAQGVVLGGAPPPAVPMQPVAAAPVHHHDLAPAASTAPANHKWPTQAASVPTFN